MAVDRHIYVYETPEKRMLIEPFTLVKKINTSHLDNICYINWTPDSRFVISASEQNDIHIYNVFSMKKYVTRKFVGHRSKIVLAYISSKDTVS